MTSESDVKRGIVYTFYSFKGGTGRTMALANVAALFAKWGRSVLVVDWDLEAPGIERFFTDNSEEARKVRASQPGVTDLLQAYANGTELDWRNCVFKHSGVSIISAGREEDEYISGVQRLNFDVLFEKHDLGAYIERLRTEWTSSFDFVLIDSRTGVTDIGGICTVHLPDILVLFFTANHSSTEGALQIAERARKAQSRLPLDRSLLIVVPVPSRDESRTEHKKAMEWKERFAQVFAEFYKDWLPRGIRAEDAIEIARIPYVPYWSFGEPLPVLLEGTSDPSSLGYAYEIVARLLVTRLNWYEALEGRTLAPPPLIKRREISKDWLEKHRTAALKGLEESGKPGFMELSHFCVDSFVTKNQPELLTIAEQASIHTFGWPIGVVLRNREEYRPRPTNDGILADLNTGHNYDYWTLTKNGDFYTLFSLFEDERAQQALFFDTRIVRTTEALLHCLNIYKGFGIETGAIISLTIRYGGLKGRKLSSASPTWLMLESRQNLHEDEVTATVTFRIGVNQAEIAGLVKMLCEPLFMVFDFATFADSIYEQIVSNFIQGRVV
jgi:cellulose biosynthesis protein BcsQ